MRPPETKKYLYDIKEACEYIAEFTLGKEYDHYHTDPMLRSAVERQLEIVGEALGQMVRKFPEMEETIPETPKLLHSVIGLFTAMAIIQQGGLGYRGGQPPSISKNGKSVAR